MYILILLILLAAAGFLIYRGYTAGRRVNVYIGTILAAGTLIFFALLDFWIEWLWFEALGFDQRFWTVVSAKLGFTLLGAVVGFLAVLLLTLALYKKTESKLCRFWLVGAVVGAYWGFLNWETALRYWYRVEAGIAEPVLNKDAGFYLFQLPFYDQIYWLLFSLICVALAAAIAPWLRWAPQSELEGSQLEINWREGAARTIGPLSIILGSALLVLAAGKLLNSYHLLFSDWGAVSGPGWTDVRIRLPAYYLSAALTAAAGLFLLGSGLSRRAKGVYPLVITASSVAGLWIVTLAIVPGRWRETIVRPLNRWQVGRLADWKISR